MTTSQYNGTGTIPLDNGKKLLYKPSDELKEAVNLVLLINRPLLLMGDPGVGKTLLAKAIANEWYPDDTKDHYFEWIIKSTTQAEEGLYRYDALRRLSDAQIFKEEKDRAKLDNIELGAEGSYFKHGTLSDAIRNSVNDNRSILLIDEIDKADIDFPNDLLHILENYEFTIPETNKKISKPENFIPPLIIITSNREKELPPAFLRRCVYFFIDFPKELQLNDILASHFANTNADELKFVTNLFIGIRNHLESRLSGTEKKIGTSEFVDWFRVVEELRNKEQNKTLDKTEEALLQKVTNWINAEMAKWVKWKETQKETNIPMKWDFSQIPFYQVLFKNIESLKLFIDRK